MIYLFSKWQKLKVQLKNKPLFIFFDYDGTLTPIVDTPNKALLAQNIKTHLENLSKRPRCKIAIISGRALEDIKKKIGLKDIIYVGNHGLEIKGPKIKFVSRVSEQHKNAIRNIYKELKTKLSSIKGIMVEDKNLTISVHYRSVDKKLMPRLKTIFYKITAFYLARQEIKLNPGKMVLEVKPPVEWNKGKAISWLLRRKVFAAGNNQIFPIYLGDDITDEDAFNVVKNKGLGIFVGGRKNSYARYYLKNTCEVIEFLKQILDIVRS